MTTSEFNERQISIRIHLHICTSEIRQQARKNRGVTPTHRKLHEAHQHIAYSLTPPVYGSCTVSHSDGTRCRFGSSSATTGLNTARDIKQLCLRQGATTDGRPQEHASAIQTKQGDGQIERMPCTANVYVRNIQTGQRCAVVKRVRELLQAVETAGKE